MKRRNFIKIVSVSGISVPLTISANHDITQNISNLNNSGIPTRKLGKTGIDVPVLTLGAHEAYADKMNILKMSRQLGINAWDTASNYANGNSEAGIGMYLKNNPDDRSNLFLSSKPPDIITPSPDTTDIERFLQKSLARLNTTYLDLYYGIHALFSPNQLTMEVRKWAEKAKKDKRIRLFGVSFHKNMVQNLKTISKLNWIDVVMFNYNFRLLQDPELNEAIETCYQSGKGLVAIKVQGVRGQFTIETDEDKNIAGHFTSQGYTEGQAKIKAVLSDKRISTASLSMPNITFLTENASAVIDKITLTNQDINLLKKYAEITRSAYCAGCAQICEQLIEGNPCISDIMRYLMYYNGYGECQRAKELFALLPWKEREKLANADYSLAEKYCPQQIPIGAQVKNALDILSQI